MIGFACFLMILESYTVLNCSELWCTSAGFLAVQFLNAVGAAEITYVPDLVSKQFSPK